MDTPQPRNPATPQNSVACPQVPITMWKNLKSLFIVEEDGGKPKTAKTLPNKQKPAPAASATSTTAKAPASAPTVNLASGSVNDRSIKVLMEAMEAANLPGFDYLEFKKALQNLEKMDFTDSVRFQTAFAAAQSMGVTPKQLEDSATHYLNVLTKEQQKFAKALSGQRSRQVGDKEAQLAKMGKEIQQQEKQIKELQAKIERAKKEQLKLKDNIAKSTKKLAQTQADFETTLKVISDGIRQDITSIKTFLK